MANQAAENTWGYKYSKKNDQPPPEIYEKVNTVVLEARPGTPPPGQTFPRLPKEDDFPKCIENRVVSLNIPKEEIQYVIVVLHGYAANQHALYEFTKKHLLGPRTACVLLRGTTPVGDTGTYCWSDKGNYMGGAEGRDRERQFIRRARTGFSSIQSSEFAGPSRSNTADVTAESPSNIPDGLDDIRDEDEIGRPTFAGCTEKLGIEVITNVLIKTCGFRARDIAIVGHNQGGTAALALAAACWETKFGGVVSIGGPLPNDFPDGIESRTHVLLLGGTLGDLKPTESARIQRAFSGTIVALTRYGPPTTDGDDYNNINDDELKEFVAHQLRREEWTKEAVITFDGGGIRGYGSLLMLRDLMAKIADYEKELDRGVEVNGRRHLSESSFSPCEYPPREINGATVPTSIQDLDDDELYLPCHYFTFVGGTSTGGLISIMISRFRMTVRDCIMEYERLGEKVFGHPRPPGPGSFLTPWHKFDADNLRNAIRDVTIRHGEKVQDVESVQYPCNEDLCKTIVAARADKGGATLPFLFRTYDCREDGPAGLKNPPLNAGRAAQCNIMDVGRATSAATNYFRPINIRNWGVKGFERKDWIPFVDGGFGTNNPSHEILRDIKRKRKAPNEVIDVFASFGTGVADENLRGKLSSLFRMVEEMKKEITNVLPAHRAMEDDSGIHNEDGHQRFYYFRFDGGKALGEVAMDEWSGRRRRQLKFRSRPTGEETLRTMQKAVGKFLKQEKVKKDLHELARILVRRRRLRTRDKVAWERYACASRQECSIAGCHAWFDTLEELEAHLESEHANVPETERLAAIREPRRCWTYRGAANED